MLFSGVKMSSEDYEIIKKLAFGFFLLSLINTVSNFFLSELNIIRVIKLKLASERLEKLIKIEKGKNLELKAIHSRIKKNPEFYREKFIREVLLMFKEGEKVIPLPKEYWYKEP